MKLPELVYQAYLRTPVVPPRRLFYYTTGGVVAATVSQNTVVVPQGYDFILQTLVIQAIGGGAQTVSRFRVRVISQESPSETTPYDIFHKIVSGSVEDVYEWQGELYIPSQTIVQVRTDFSAGAIVNNQYIFMTGFFVPQIELMK